ncbi:MAG: biopolymer transporter ExbD [Candidimonas sp.]|nr:MAG: biopolymer transporter ExbD [Candidimonas sp.]
MSESDPMEGDEALSEINMIPFIDVMLVLLIVFIITVPVIYHAVNVNLPRASDAREVVTPETVELTIDAAGRYFLDRRPVTDGELMMRLHADAAKDPQPDLHIRGDRDVRYERVAQAMATAQRAGIRKIGFVTKPVR